MSSQITSYGIYASKVGKHTNYIVLLVTTPTTRVKSGLNTFLSFPSAKQNIFPAFAVFALFSAF
jgi:hypothetical protein